MSKPVPFEWLSARLDRFGVGDNAHGSLDQSMPWRVKPLVELTWLLTVLRRHDANLPGGAAAFAWCAKEARDFDWHALAAFDPSAAAPMAILADAFAMYGETPPFELDYFFQIARADYFAGMDRVPYREMDIIYCLWRLGASDLYRHIGRLFGNTAFGRGLPLHRYSIDDIYSLTHALFYLTDVGLSSVEDKLSASEIERLRSTLLALIVIMVRSDNCDVLGELLICWMFCGFAATEREVPYLIVADRRFLSNHAGSGAVASTRMSLQREEAGSATFEEIYHTTLVAALWLAVRPAELRS